jgi:Txe/YoeB family toxin of Txe-Axe toxin-antitoxin module
MKRVAVIVAAAVIATTAPACAESDLEFRIADHNQYCYLTSAKEITGTPETDEGEKETHFTFRVTENVRCIFTVRNDSVTTFSCVCLSDSETDEFLAQCVTGCYTFCGTETGINSYDPILYRFLLARGGHEEEDDSSIPGVVFSLGKASFGYYFILTKTE